MAVELASQDRALPKAGVLESGEADGLEWTAGYKDGLVRQRGGRSW